MSKPKIQLNFSAQLERPTYWFTEGSKYRRLSSAQAELKNALPDDAPETAAYLLRQVEVMRPGTYNGFPFGTNELYELEQYFNRESPPELQVDHSWSAHDTHGVMLDVMRVDADSARGLPERVVALIAYLGQYAVERALDGRWRKYSLGLYLAPCVIDELSVVRKPAVPTATNLSKENEMKVNGTIEPKAVELSQGVPAPTPEAAPAVDPAGVTLSAAEAENERLKAELSSLRKEKETADLLILENSVRLEINALVRDGFSSPALAEDQVKFCVGLSTEQRAQYVSLCRKSAPIWLTGRESVADQSEPGTPSAGEVAELSKRVKKFEF